MLTQYPATLTTPPVMPTATAAAARPPIPRQLHAYKTRAVRSRKHTSLPGSCRARRADASRHSGTCSGIAHGDCARP